MTLRTLHANLIGAALVLMGCAGPTSSTLAAAPRSGSELPKVCGVVMLHTTGGMPRPGPGWKPVDRNGPLGGATVELRGFKGDAIALGETVASTRTDPEGHFCLSAPPATYSVLVTKSEGGHPLASTLKFGGVEVMALAHSEIALDNGDVRGLVLQAYEPLPE